MSGWLEDHLLTDLKEKMKHKATEVQEYTIKYTIKGKSKVEFHKTLSDDYEEEILETDDPPLSKVLQRIDRMNEKIAKTSEDVRRMPTSSRSPPTKESPFVTRESSAFATLTEVCGGVNKYEWSDDSEEDKTHALKMEIPPFDGRNSEKYAEKFGRYLVLTALQQRISDIPILVSIAKEGAYSIKKNDTPAKNRNSGQRTLQPSITCVHARLMTIFSAQPVRENNRLSKSITVIYSQYILQAPIPGTSQSYRFCYLRIQLCSPLLVLACVHVSLLQ